MFEYLTKVFTPGNLYTGMYLRISWKKFVYANKEESTPKVEEHKNNFMLFHGTNFEGASGILHSGFKNSASGDFGSGVYLTECGEVIVIGAISQPH